MKSIQNVLRRKDPYWFQNVVLSQGLEKEYRRVEELLRNDHVVDEEFKKKVRLLTGEDVIQAMSESVDAIVRWYPDQFLQSLPTPPVESILGSVSCSFCDCERTKDTVEFLEDGQIVCHGCSYYPDRRTQNIKNNGFLMKVLCEDGKRVGDEVQLGVAPTTLQRFINLCTDLLPKGRGSRLRILDYPLKRYPNDLPPLLVEELSSYFTKCSVYIRLLRKFLDFIDFEFWWVGFLSCRLINKKTKEIELIVTQTDEDSWAPFLNRVWLKSVEITSYSCNILKDSYFRMSQHSRFEFIYCLHFMGYPFDIGTFFTEAFSCFFAYNDVNQSPFINHIYIEPDAVRSVPKKFKVGTALALEHTIGNEPIIFMSFHSTWVALVDTVVDYKQGLLIIVPNKGWQLRMTLGLPQVMGNSRDCCTYQKACDIVQKGKIVACAYVFEPTWNGIYWATIFNKIGVWSTRPVMIRRHRVLKSPLVVGHTDISCATKDYRVLLDNGEYDVDKYFEGLAFYRTYGRFPK
jgi:hypothetical protein